ncbi:MAG TPA: FAD-binding oxidoreductase [Candidatus Dormibacteraeota bacterium]|nr:FAD-binding oxidoreductase [Candidatus Dormibacteraeota bacterium]
MIAVLGGGVAGAALAWALGQRGRRDVVVYDPLPAGSGSTARAFGGFRTQQGSPINVALSLSSRPFFEARADRIDFRSVGYLYLARGDEAVRELRARAELQCEQGLPVEHPDPTALVPFLDATGIQETNYCALDGTYQPLEILGCLVEEATAAGAEFRYGTEARPADLEAAEMVAVCAGIWSRAVGQELGVRLEVTPEERGIFQAGPYDWLPAAVPVTLELDTGYHFRERDGRLLLIGPDGPREWTGIRDWVRRMAPRTAVDQPEAHWSGFYEVTFDHHPLVGATEREGVWASCGFSGHGVMQAPAVGDCLAAMMLGQTPPIDISALSPLRTEQLVDRTQL